MTSISTYRMISTSFPYQLITLYPQKILNRSKIARIFPIKTLIKTFCRNILANIKKGTNP